MLAAKKIGISGALLLAICTNETGLKNMVSPNDGGSHSYGVCQVKKATAKMMGYEVTGNDLMRPEVNAEVAAHYLKYQIDRYDNDLMKSIGAYNAGRYHESKIVPGKPRNLKYVKRVLKIYHKLKKNETL